MIRMAAGISETGAQLFVRLGSKPSLELLDPNLFPSPDFPCPGDAVEFYGPSGCGKTEMLLHLISNSILPKTWREAELGGLGVGVILVDADYQFSMLRLYHILERRIMDAMERTARLRKEVDLKTTGDSSCHDLNCGSEHFIPSEMEHCETCTQRNGRTDVSNRTGGSADGLGTCQCKNNHEATSVTTGKKRTGTGEIKSSNQAEFVMPTAEEMEAFIKSCLNRFYLVRSGGSSDQFIVTLHSLESLIANRPDVSVLMLENIAAFYWTDRTSGGVASTQETNQRRAVSIIKRLIGEYQLVLFATKPALIQRNQRSNFWKDEGSATPTTRSIAKDSDTSYEHHEFMSNAWNKLITHRFIMRRHEHAVHVKNQMSTQLSYTALRSCPSSDHLCRFCITDKGVVHQ